MSNKLIISLQELYESYKKWVSTNPQFVSDLECTTKWLSYFIAGRMSNSSIISELIYSVSNIIVLFNDRIIEKANGLRIDENSSNTLKLMLTTLEYCEVFIEISAKKLWGSKGRWILIVIVQILKTIGRYLLFHKYHEEIIRVPPIPVLDRKKIQRQQQNPNFANESYPSTSQDSGSSSMPVGLGDLSFTVKLKRSGRIIRRIEGAPPMHLRHLKPICVEINIPDEKIKQLFKNAERLFIAKPLIHLGAVGLFGYKSWKSYVISLMIDLISVRMYYKHKDKLTKQQKLELSRRCVNMLLYFVRSPFYERSTERRLKNFIKSIGDNIPLMNSVCYPLIEYIPHWQDTYFYMWSG